MAHLRDLWCSQLFRDVLHPLLLQAGPPALVPDAGDGHAEDPGAPASSTGGAAGEADTLAVQAHPETSCNDPDLKPQAELKYSNLTREPSPVFCLSQCRHVNAQEFCQVFLALLGR